MKAREGLQDTSELTGVAAICQEVLDFSKLDPEKFPENMFAVLLETQRDRVKARLAGLKSAEEFITIISSLVNFTDRKRQLAKLKLFGQPFAMFVKHISVVFSRSSPTFYPKPSQNSYCPGHPLAGTQCAGVPFNPNYPQKHLKTLY